MTVRATASAPRRAALPLACLALLAACSAAELRSEPPHGNWSLTSLAGAARSGATLAFMDGDRVAGHGGCNRYSSTAQAGADGTLAIGPIAATKRACLDGDAMQLETAFFAMLGAARGYRHQPDRRLQLLDGAGAVLAEFDPADPGRP